MCLYSSYNLMHRSAYDVSLYMRGLKEYSKQCTLYLVSRLFHGAVTDRNNIVATLHVLDNHCAILRYLIKMPGKGR